MYSCSAQAVVALMCSPHPTCSFTHLISEYKTHSMLCPGRVDLNKWGIALRNSESSRDDSCVYSYLYSNDTRAVI